MRTTFLLDRQLRMLCDQTASSIEYEKKNELDQPRYKQDHGMKTHFNFAKMHNWNEACCLTYHSQQERIVHSYLCRSCSGTWSLESRTWTTKPKKRATLEWISREFPLSTSRISTVPRQEPSRIPFSIHIQYGKKNAVRVLNVFLEGTKTSRKISDA